MRIWAAKVGDKRRFGDGRCLFHHETPSHPILVYENTGYRWLSFGNRTVQAAMARADDSELVLSYTPIVLAGLHFVPAAKTSCVLGLGGGTLVKYLLDNHPHCHVTAVDIEPVMIDVATRFFHCPREHERLTLVIGDAIDYVSTLQDPVDVLIVDLFTARAMPEAMYSAAFYKDCCKAVSEYGVCIANLVNTRGEFFPVYQHFRQAFDHQTLCINIEGYDNTIVFGFKNRYYTKIVEQLTRKKKLIKPQLDPVLGLVARSFIIE